MEIDAKTNNLVFKISLLLTGGIALWAVVFNDSFTVVSNATFTFLTRQFGWLYQVAMLFFVIFVLMIAVSKWGHIRLGPDDSRPEFPAWGYFVGIEDVNTPQSVYLMVFSL